MVKSAKASIKRLVAEWFVDEDFYLARYPDVAAAGVDPVDHFAQCWRYAPVRAPSARAETWIYRVSPIVAWICHLTDRDRTDWLDCLRYRINDQASAKRRWGLALSLAIARSIGGHRTRPAATAVRAGLGTVAQVVRVWIDHRDWLTLHRITKPGRAFRFTVPHNILSSDPPVEREVPLPDLWSAQLQNAAVYGFSQVCVNGEFVAYEPEADPAFLYTSRQCEFTISCFPPEHLQVLTRMPEVAENRIDQGILLGGRCGANYFHFLIEYVTKGYVLEQAGVDEALPLIVPLELYSQEFEILHVVFPDRPLIRRPHASRLDVGRLYVPSVMTFCPDCPTTEFWQAAAVNYESLSWLRERVFKQLAPATEASPRRIFLARSAGRNIANAAEVRATFEARGFAIVDPALLTFREQVLLFSGATHVAGAIGAAFSNIIFMPPGGRVLGIVSPFAVEFALFASLARFARCAYFALPGRRADYRAGMEKKRQSLATTHGDFRVDLTDLDRGLDRFLEVTSDPSINDGATS